MWFYLVMALSLLSRFRWILLFAFFTLSVTILPALTGHTPTLATSGYSYSSAYLSLVSNPIVYLFLTGVVSGVIYPFLITFRLMMLRRILLIVSVALTIYCITSTSLLNHGLNSSGIYLSLLFIATVLNDDLFTKCTPVQFIYLGEISFSLYLIHTLMNSGIWKYFEVIGITDGVSRFILSCTLSILLASLSYKYIETPINKFRS